ncbi:MAG: pilus assembly protein [Coriobacteriaceae bacterium]|nr:MAG: pilus assembly protein [Coriobacteriaceae bacterium]
MFLNSCSTEVGQASVEAAFLIPIFSLALSLLLQPLCLLYTKTVMWNAAAETARLAETNDSSEDCTEFAKRRLAALPELPLFHEGEWEIEIDGAQEQQVTVTITGYAKPLPFLGLVAAMQNAGDTDRFELKTQVTEQLRPEWLEGDYAEWIEAWDDV